MSNIEIYTIPTCPYCHRAKAALDQLRLGYTEIDVSRDPQKVREMMVRSGGHTVPQIFVDQQSIGGSDELIEMITNGEFFDLLENTSGVQQPHKEEGSHVA